MELVVNYTFLKASIARVKHRSDCAWRSKGFRRAFCLKEAHILVGVCSN